MEGLENELWCRWSEGKVEEWTELLHVRWAELILQPFLHVTAHSPTLTLLYLRHSTSSNPSIVSPMSQLILQSFFCFSSVTGSSLMSPGIHRYGASGSMHACHAAGPGSISGWDKFPGWGFFRGFSSPVRRISFSHHNHPSLFHYGRQWLEMLMRPKTSNIHTYIHTSPGYPPMRHWIAPTHL